MDLAFIDKLSADQDYLEEVSPNFWLMDDHRWAYYVWEKIRGNNRVRYALAHLDFHYDGVNDFQDTAARNRLLDITSLSEIYNLVKDGERVQYDSFIALAIIRGFIGEVHFFCCQSEEDTDRGIDEDILSQYGCKQFFYCSSEELVAGAKYTPLLFDLCLDLFNRDDDKVYEGTLWTDSEILALWDACHPLLASASAVTVSMSFGYSGTEEQTLSLIHI